MLFRSINTKKFVNIKIDVKSFLPSVLLMLAGSVVMLSEAGGQWVSFGVTLAISALVVIINFKSVKDIITLLLGKFIKKRGNE